MVVARDRYVAEDACQRIRVDLRAAARRRRHRGRPRRRRTLVHDDVPGNVARPHAAGGRRRRGRHGRRAAPLDPRPGHRAQRLHARWRARASTPAGTPTSGSLRLYSSTQTTTGVRAAVAAKLGLPLGQGRVHRPRRRRRLRRQDHAPVARGGARAVGRPQRSAATVKWTEDRREHFISCAHERGQLQEVDRRLRRRGPPARASTCGSGTTTAPTRPTASSSRSSPPPSCSGPTSRAPTGCEFWSLYTNTVLVTPYRGAGRPQGCFAMERTMDAIADAPRPRPRRGALAQLHPARRDALRPRPDLPGRPAAEVRLRRLPGHPWPSSRRWSAGTTSPAYRDAGRGRGPPGRPRHRLLRRGHRRRPLRGRPRAGRDQRAGQRRHRPDHPGPGPPDRLRPDRRRGARRAARGRPRHHRRHPPDAVRRGHVRLARRGHERQRGRPGRPQGAGQGAADRGRRPRGVARRPRDRRRRRARSRARPARRSPLSARSPCCPTRCATRSTRPPSAATQFAGTFDPDKPPVADDEEPGLEGKDFYSPTQATFANGMHAAIVETDPVTAEITILRYCVVHDCGTMINPMIVEGQVHGGVAQGVGGALYERMAYDESGQLLNASFMDFLMPYASEVPHIETDHLETPSARSTRSGIKGAGEAGCIPVSAVIASAIEDAEGFPITLDADLARRALGAAPAPRDGDIPSLHPVSRRSRRSSPMKISGSRHARRPPSSRSGRRSTTRPCSPAACPAASRCAEIGDDRYAMTVTAGVAAIKGTYDGEVSLSDQVSTPSSLHAARPSGAGAPGTVDADVKVQLAPSAGRRHRPLLRRRRRRSAGSIGGVGQRMLAGVTKKMAGQFFTARRPRHRRRAARSAPRRRRAAAAAPGSGRRGPASGAVYPGRAATANANATARTSTTAPASRVGVLVGGLLALAGVARRRAVTREAATDARLHRRRRPGRPRRRARSPPSRRGEPRQAASTSPAAASRPPAPSSSCCPSRRPPASPPAAPPRSCGTWSPSCPAPSSSRSSDVAAELGVHVCVGTYERGPERGVVYNSSVLIDPRGELLGVYRKTHPFCTEAVVRRRLGHPRRHGHGVRHRARPDRHDHLLRRRLPRAVAHPGGAGRRGHLPPVGAAALGRHLGAHLPGPGLRQPRVRRRRQRHRHRPGRGALLRQLAHRHADRPHRGQGRHATRAGCRPGSTPRRRSRR